MTCISLDSVFWLNNTCDASMPLISFLPKAPLKAFSDRMKRRQNNQIPWWGSYTLSDRVNHLRNLHFIFAKLLKPPDRRSIKEWMIGNSVKSVLSCNRLRLGKAISPTGIKLKGWIECQTYLKWERILYYRHGTYELYSA